MSDCSSEGSVGSAMSTYINDIRRQFLCCTSMQAFYWFGYFEYMDMTLAEQDLLISRTTECEMVRKYPIKFSYQKTFLKFLINKLSEADNVADSIYNSFGRLVSLDDTGEFVYKHYEVYSHCVISLKESRNVISEGTTGLSTWQASQVLSEWCLDNRWLFYNQHVIELGCGTGLTGFAIAFHCNPSHVTMTDCHDSVLNMLKENRLFNLLNDPRTKTIYEEDRNFETEYIRVVNLPWESINLKTLDYDCWKYNVVVAADVVYDPKLFGPLIDAFQCLICFGASQVLLAVTERNSETLNEFLKRLTRTNLKYEVLELPRRKYFTWSNEVPIRLFSITRKAEGSEVSIEEKLGPHLVLNGPI